ncbi:rho guanine nucleotide exchange factor 7, partial [Elysia marginata]
MAVLLREYDDGDDDDDQQLPHPLQQQSQKLFNKNILFTFIKASIFITRLASCTPESPNHIVHSGIWLMHCSTSKLCFKKGDVITVTQCVDGGWWEGTLNGRTGWFPSNYTKEIKA